MLAVGRLRPDAATRVGSRAVGHDGGTIATTHQEIGVQAAADSVLHGDLRPGGSTVGTPLAEAAGESIAISYWIRVGVGRGSRTGDDVPTFAVAEPDDLGRPVGDDVSGGVRIVLEIVVGIGAGVGEVAGGENGATYFLGYQLHAGKGRDGIGSAAQQVVHGTVETAIEDVDAVIRSGCQGLAIGGSSSRIVGASLVGIPELSSEFLSIGTGGGVVGVRDGALVGADENVGMAVVSGNGMGGRGAVVVGGGDDERQHVDLTASGEGPQHGLIA